MDRKAHLMPEITLKPITNENLRPVIKLKVADDQNNFVAPNVQSIAQAYVNPTWQPLAIYADADLVGFTLLGRDADTGFDWIIRFMIGTEHQGKGHGKAALLAVIHHLKAQPDNTHILLSYVPGNAIAEGLYRAVGFAPTGEVDEGEIVMQLGNEELGMSS